jgi:hypothetical protein
MPSTYTLISSNVLSSTASSVTFSAIPSTYTDLLIKMSIRNNGDNGNNAAAAYIQFNGDTAANYSFTYLYNSVSTSAVSSSGSGNVDIEGYFISNGSNSTANTFANSEYYIPNYNSSVAKQISYVGAPENNSTSLDANSIGAGLYRGTSPITSLKIQRVYGTAFVAGSSFYLYGIKNS